GPRGSHLARAEVAHHEPVPRQDRREPEEGDALTICLPSGDVRVAGWQQSSQIHRTTSSGTLAESATIVAGIVTSAAAGPGSSGVSVVELAAARMRETKSDDAFSAANALAFLATPPRTVAVPLPAPAPARDVAPPPPQPENAYAEADKASY